MKLDFQLGNTPPYLLNFKGSVGERHRECVEIASKESLVRIPLLLATQSPLSVHRQCRVSTQASYEAAMWYARQINTNPAYAGLYDDMRKAILSLTGLDVYWNGPVEAAAKGAAGAQKARATKVTRLYRACYLSVLCLMATIVRLVSAQSICDLLRQDVHHPVSVHRRRLHGRCERVRIVLAGTGRVRCRAQRAASHSRVYGVREAQL